MISKPEVPFVVISPNMLVSASFSADVIFEYLVA